VRDCVFKGAELVVRIQGYMHPCNEQQRIISQVRAFESNVYFAVANMAGESGQPACRWFVPSDLLSLCHVVVHNMT
jgi:predicted amidohydrolase